jgi:hypothetical protein
LIAMACHPSAGPLYTLLLRALSADTGAEEEKDGGAAGHDEDEASSKTTTTTTTTIRFTVKSRAEHYAVTSIDYANPSSCGEKLRQLSRDLRGSLFLETLFRVCHDGLYATLLDRMGLLPADDNNGDDDDDDALTELVSHNVGNFVLQTVLTTLRSRQSAERFLKLILAEDNVSTRVREDKRRRGVLWRVAEAAATWAVGQETFCKRILSKGGRRRRQEEEEEDDDGGGELQWLMNVRWDDDERVRALLMILFV